MSEVSGDHVESNFSAVHQAADMAVEKVFSLLGVDVHSPESIESFRQDLRFGGKLRRLADQGMMAMVGMFFIAMGTAIWLGVVTLLKAR
jgi:hypothetical protein